LEPSQHLFEPSQHLLEPSQHLFGTISAFAWNNLSICLEPSQHSKIKLQLPRSWQCWEHKHRICSL